MTTAFKMNENTFPIEESSVTSDRYYDDLHLDFNLSSRMGAPLVYYNLTEKVLKNSTPISIRHAFSFPKIFPEKRWK